MRLEPEIIDIPDKLVKKYYKNKKEHCFNYRLIHKEARDGKIWAWAWNVHTNYQNRDPEFCFDILTILYENGKTWHSWDGEKWCKKKLAPNNGNYYYAGYNVISDSDIDKKTFGRTIEAIQDEKRISQAKARAKIKDEKINKMLKTEKPVPKSVLKWIHSKMPHFIIFDVFERKRGYCTYCRDYQTFDYLKNDKIYKCPGCGRRIKARSSGKIPKDTCKTFSYFQKMKDGLMLRYVWVKRVNVPDFEYIYEESLRATVTNDGVQTWFEKRDYPFHEWKINRVNGWVKSYNGPFIDYISSKNEDLLPEERGTFKEWAKLSPITKYAADQIDEFIAEDNERVMNDDRALYYTDWYKNQVTYGRASDFLDIYQTFVKYPMVETLLKMGFVELCRNVFARVGSKENIYFKKSKIMYKFLDIDEDFWKILHQAAVNKEPWIRRLKLEDMEQYSALRYTKIKPSDYKTIMDYYGRGLTEIIGVCKEYDIAFEKVSHYVKKNDVYIWKDYIKMAADMGLDLADKFTIFPKKVREAHDELIYVRNLEKNLEEQKKANKKIKSFLRTYNKVKKYHLENDEFVIFPAASPGEIVKEGQRQHNCVGRAGYIEKMIKGETIIFFLRYKDSPETSYYTVEFSPKGSLIQAYAKYNKKTDDYEENILPFLEKLGEKISGKKHIAG